MVKSLPENVRIYTNGSDVVGFWTTKETLSVPAKWSSGTKIPNPYFNEALDAICKDLKENKTVLFYFNAITWRTYLPSQDEIVLTCQISVIQRFADGTMYGRNYK